eukprot:GSChrysophyteH1.ASY1.ANO1.473.1 assembled CDS
MDLKNNMPSKANQEASVDQTIPLDKNRVKSSIPKGGTDNDTWQYPSPQMFWNALVRKQKEDGASEEDIDVVVAVHNNMNENTWKQLLRFLGRPDDLSPKAYLKSIFGHPKPFDRHDWYVDCGGQERRYVIDYYHDERYEGKDAKPTSMHDSKSLKSINIEVRPAMDSLDAIIGRLVVMPFYQLTNNKLVKHYNEVPFFPKKDMLQAEDIKLKKMSAQWSEIQSACRVKSLALENCSTETECSIAAVELQKCTGKIVCPDVVQRFNKCVQSDSNKGTKADVSDDLERAYGALVKCLEMFEIESRNELSK